MTSRFTVLAMSLASVVALAACGGSAATTGPAGPTGAAATSGPPAATAGGAATMDPGPGAVITPCTLLTAAALKTATGDDYGEGVDDGYGQCVWRVGGATSNNGEGQIVAAVVESPLSTLKSSFAGGVDLTIGGKAAYWNPGEGLQTLWIDLGARSLALSFDPVTAETLAIATKVAEAAASGL